MFVRSALPTAQFAHSRNMIMLGMLRRLLEIRRVQNRLKAVLAQDGIDFMQLRPDIHTKLLQEVLRSGDGIAVAHRFVRIAKDVAQLQHLNAREKQWQLVAAMLESDMPAEEVRPPVEAFGQAAWSPTVAAVGPRSSGHAAPAEALLQAR
jgi:hypothetical protein